MVVQTRDVHILNILRAVLIMGGILQCIIPITSYGHAASAGCALCAVQCYIGVVKCC
jgi:hypothetical protein